MLTQSLGLSLALGAFLAGLIISESDYSHQAMTVMMPFRDVFMSLFFVSVGLLLDMDYLLANPVRIALLTAGILIIKPVIAAVSALVVGLPLREAIPSGLALGQVGEFSLVAAQAGVAAGLLSTSDFQTVLDTAVLSMLFTPALVAIGPHVVKLADRTRLVALETRRFSGAQLEGAHDFSDHMLIAGYGVTGRAVARAATDAGVPYAIVEIDPTLFREGLDAGHPIFYGDATQEEILRYVGAQKARAIVITIDNVAAARRATELARRLAPEAHLLIRTKHPREIQPLLDLGADDIVSDQVEVSVEVLSRALSHLDVPAETVELLKQDAYDRGRVDGVYFC